MKKLTTILLVVGLISFLASAASFWYHFTKTNLIGIGDAIGLIATGTFACVAVFMWSRARAGIGLFEVTKKDREQFKEARYDLNIWRLLARLLGVFASVSWFFGIRTLIFPRSPNERDWHLSVELMAVGLLLALCSVLLFKRAK